MFAFYADESTDFSTGGDWLVLLAIGFDDKHWHDIDDPIIALKRKYFPGWNLTDVEIKSVYIRRWNQPDKPWPPNPFATLQEAEVRAFSEDLFKLVYETLPIEWCAAAVNRPELIRKHGVATQLDVYLWAYMFLTERIQGWLGGPRGVNDLGRLFLDQQHQRLVGGASHNEIIKRHYSYQTIGTGFLELKNIIEQPYFMESCRSSHLQIADILAYNVLRQARNGFTLQSQAYEHYARMVTKCRGFRSWYGKGLATPYGLKVYPKN